MQPRSRAARAHTTRARARTPCAYNVRTVCSQHAQRYTFGPDRVAQLTGIDISGGMLQQAAARVAGSPQLRGAAITLAQVRRRAGAWRAHACTCACAHACVPAAPPAPACPHEAPPFTRRPTPQPCPSLARRLTAWSTRSGALRGTWVLWPWSCVLQCLQSNDALSQGALAGPRAPQCT